jgi:hypothetical protein
MYDYYKWFYEVWSSGMIQGLRHPVEWWCDAHRNTMNLPGMTYWAERHAHRFFNEMYDLFVMPDVSADPPTLKEWLCSIYPKKHMFKEDLEETMIAAYDKRGE